MQKNIFSHWKSPKYLEKFQDLADLGAIWISEKQVAFKWIFRWFYAFWDHIFLCVWKMTFSNTPTPLKCGKFRTFFLKPYLTKPPHIKLNCDTFTYRYLFFPPTNLAIYSQNAFSHHFYTDCMENILYSIDGWYWYGDIYCDRRWTKLSAKCKCWMLRFGCICLSAQYALMILKWTKM